MEYINLTNTSDIFTITSDNQGLAIRGLNGDDVISGGLSPEAFNGNRGNDTLVGFGGTDTLMGGQDDDLIYAGYPNTPFLLSGAILLLYEAANTTLEGNQGNDIVSGGNGDDFIRGGQGNDSLVGGAGNDFLWGATDSDTLTGGIGRDTFFLRPSDGIDIITDFDKNQDFIAIGDNTSFFSDLPDLIQPLLSPPPNIELVQQGSAVSISFTSFDPLAPMATVENITVDELRHRFALPTFIATIALA